MKAQAISEVKRESAFPLVEPLHIYDFRFEYNSEYTIIFKSTWDTSNFS